MSTFSVTPTLFDLAGSFRSVPPVIPPENTNKTLVLCFDGTGDQFDDDNSNIVQLCTLLKKDDNTKQMIYYQAGIGTYTSPQIATPFMSSLAKTLDEMIAWSLDNHVIGGYEFLMQNYKIGDRICIFGFSRGAYTARALAGMVHKVGLLPACNFQQVPFAYKMYTRADDIGWQQSNAFKRAFSVDVDIEFVGVWDTVNSVGLIPRKLPFTTSNTIVRTFRHAVSLDERRAKFKANLWNRPNAVEQTLGFHNSVRIGPNIPSPTSPKPLAVDHTQTPSEGTNKTQSGDHHRTPTLSQLEDKYGSPLAKPTDVEEVWFSGCHCDVGGGSVANGTPHSLARISIRWMVRECFKARTGIMFESDRLRDIGLDPASLYPVVRPRPPHLPVENARLRSHKTDSCKTTSAPLTNVTSDGEPVAVGSTSAGLGTANVPPASGMTEEEHELHDSLSPVYDQLQLAWSWWILELFPVRHRYQRGDDSWITKVRMNLGQPRFIPKQRVHGFKVHRSVKMRMMAQPEEGKKNGYHPRPEFLADPTWVD